MKKFMDQDFLLRSEVAKELYNNYAKDMPIFDYHCHLVPQEIHEDHSFENITEIFLKHDHYKWRMMRVAGISEEYITGNASDKDKFKAFATALGTSIGNPMHHWTNLELKNYFGIDKPLNESTWEEIWDKANAIIKDTKMSAKQLIRDSKVNGIGTTDDPIDSLEYHIAMKEDTTFETKVLPTFRPDKGLGIHKETFLPWIKQLSEVSGIEITDIKSLKEAFASRVEHFHNVGGRMSDHSLEATEFIACSEEELDAIFKKALSGEEVTYEETRKYQSMMMVFLGQEYHKRDWAMQLHIGATRNNSTRMFEKLGADAGFDGLNDQAYIQDIKCLLDTLDCEDKLPKTVLYCLNPKDNYSLLVLAGCYYEGGKPGKVQFGPAWWFIDTKPGMEKQLSDFANLSSLGMFIGMTTDSRSFLSYSRHEYFRRILCDVVGTWIENGEVPYETEGEKEIIANIIKGICYNNADNYIK